MEKYIFLDVDGVMNHQIWYQSELFQKFRKEFKQLHDEGKKEESNALYDKSQFSRESVALLNDLTSETGAKIVVSSSWRMGRTVKELQNLLYSVGVSGEVIDKTPYLTFTGVEGYNYSVPRGCEIKAWLELNKEKHGEKITKIKYVIFDDDSDMLYWQRNNYIQIDPYCGLTPMIIRKAKLILGTIKEK